MALSAKATQEFVPIKEIRDGIIVLKDDGLRAIVLANSTNLSLKSADEQKRNCLEAIRIMKDVRQRGLDNKQFDAGKMNGRISKN